jgi:hypothetical protein
MNNKFSSSAILTSLFLLRSFIGFAEYNSIGKIAYCQLENNYVIELFKDKKKEAHLIVLDSVYESFNGLTVVCNGLLESTGDMQPRVKVGLIRRNNMGQWDTIVDLGSVGVLPFGPEKFKWNNDTLKILPPVQFYPTVIEQIQFSGVYKLTFVSYHKGKPHVQSSNEFIIEPNVINTHSVKQLKGFLDTTAVQSYHFSEIRFYHSRVFTGAAESAYNVWHKIRIYAPDLINSFLFEKTFTYAIYPNATNKDFFETMDYNLDAVIDFRIKCYDGSFDYYLWDYSKNTYVYSEIFSNAYSFSIDNEVNTLTANFSFFVPLEGTYDLEGNFSLKDMRLHYLKRRIHTVNGTTLEPVDLSVLSYPLKLTYTDLPQPEISTIASRQYPDVASNKKHYFPTDSVYIITNELGNLYDIDKLDFELELLNQISSEWQLVSPNVNFREREMVKIDNGYKIKIGNVDMAAKSDLVGSHALIPGRYRVTVRFGKEVVNQTPEFYVY